MVRRRSVGHNRPDSLNVNINFNLGQLQSNNLVLNAMVKDLDVILDDLVTFVHRFW